MTASEELKLKMYEVYKLHHTHLTLDRFKADLWKDVRKRWANITTDHCIYLMEHDFYVEKNKAKADKKKEV